MLDDDAAKAGLNASGAAADSAGGLARSATASNHASALFGLRKKRADPAAKLREAATALEERVAQLEERVSEGRGEARQAMQLGKRAHAMRALKKAKATEKQMMANQASLDALEVQLGMLEDAAVQKTLASALASSSKGMKSQRKLLSRAEAAIDDAADVRDVAVELTDVMSEFANGVHVSEDDEALLSELEAMVACDALDAQAPQERRAEAHQAAAEAQPTAAHDTRVAEQLQRRLPRAPGGKVASEDAGAACAASAR